MEDEVVELDVGGTIFKTRVSTLAQSRYFSNIFLTEKFERWPEGKRLFVDRCPELFKHVLRVLREPRYALPEECLLELDFYGIEWSAKEESVEENEGAIVDFSYREIELRRTRSRVFIGGEFYHADAIAGLYLSYYAGQNAPGEPSLHISTVYVSEGRLETANSFNLPVAEEFDLAECLEHMVRMLNVGRKRVMQTENGGWAWMYIPEKIPAEQLRSGTVALGGFSIKDAEWFKEYCFRRERFVAKGSK